MKEIVTKNYSTDGGDTWVIGGKLVVEEGAEVEGLGGGGDAYVLPAATAEAIGGVKLAAKQNALDNSADLSDLVAAFNGLLTALKTAGVMAST